MQENKRRDFTDSHQIHLKLSNSNLENVSAFERFKVFPTIIESLDFPWILEDANQENFSNWSESETFSRH